MTKNEFLHRLSDLLSQLPEQDRQRYLESYAELMEDKMEEGMDEQEAVRSLGDVREIADEILRNTPLPVLMRTAARPKRGWSAGSIVLIILGSPVWLPLLLAFGAVLLTVYVTIWAIVAALFAVVAALLLAAVACVAGMFFAHGIGGVLLCFGAALGLAGVGLLLGLGVLALTRGMALLTRQIFRWTKGLFIRRR